MLALFPNEDADGSGHDNIELRYRAGDGRSQNGQCELLHQSADTEEDSSDDKWW